MSMLFCPADYISKNSTADMHQEALLLAVYLQTPDDQKTAESHVIASFMTPNFSVSLSTACFLQTGLLYPLELAWTRLAADTAAKGDKRLYTGLLHCLQQTYHAEGTRGSSLSQNHRHVHGVEDAEAVKCSSP